MLPHPAASSGHGDNDDDDDERPLACGVASMPDVEDIHRRAILDRRSTYVDPVTNFTVFTELAHLKRGTCCGNRCRHCPYGWSNVRDDMNARVAHSSSSTTRGNGECARATSGDRDGTSMLVGRIMDGTYYDDERACHNGDDANRRRGTIGVAVGGAGKLSNAIEDDASSRTAARSTADDARGPGRDATVQNGEGEKGYAALGTSTTKNVPYTRGGDAGTSQLFTGERRSKDDVLFEALGTVDELCSVVGVVYAMLNTSRAEQPRRRPRRPPDDEIDELERTIGPDTSSYGDLPEQLLDVMSRLFDVGSHIACPPAPRMRRDDKSPTEGARDDGSGFNPRHTTVLEGWIDSMTEELPELLSFIIPTGSSASAQLHVARTVCRRAERRMVPLVRDHGGNVDAAALAYVNRLSDYLFTAARYVNYCDGKDEVQYRVEGKVPGDGNGKGGANFNSRQRVVVKLKE
jgi:cob(I)alamin adenosyltransferase